MTHFRPLHYNAWALPEAIDTKVFRIDPKAGVRREDLVEPARLLAEGGLVAFPTETVYGIGVRHDDAAALDRLNRVKGRDPAKLVTLHIPRPELVSSHVERVPPRARRLMAKFWPGPLTIVFPGAGGRGIGVRVPAHPVAYELLELARVPVLATSANLSGEPPLSSGEAVVRAFSGEVDAIVDGGDAPIREASTVVRISDDGWECLREGIITHDMLARQLTQTVLFVCTGNSCRSPMAEVLFKAKLAKRLGVPAARLPDYGFRVLSAGTAAADGFAASPPAVRTLEERGLGDLASHQTRALSLDLTEQATHVFAMSPSHARSIVEWWPEHRAKVHVLDEQGVIDPIGGSIELYRRCADHLDRLLDDALERFFKDSVEGPPGGAPPD